MRAMQNALLMVLLLLFAGLANYEFVAKADALYGTALPGWFEARRVERVTSYRPTTGLPLVDMALHEGREALSWYAELLA